MKKHIVLLAAMAMISGMAFAQTPEPQTPASQEQEAPAQQEAPAKEEAPAQQEIPAETPAPVQSPSDKAE